MKTARSFGTLTLVALGLLASGPAAAQNWSEYIAACKTAVKFDEASIPDTFDCRNGIVIPIEKNGAPIAAKTDLDSTEFTDQTKCDAPPILSDVSKGGIGQCVPNSTLQSNFPTDGKAGYVLLCRNYVFRSLDKQAITSKYDDMAMIIYNANTGGTCFFQQLESEISTAILGNNVPSPFEQGADSFWLAPTTIKGFGCANCHDANPFIRTPYIMQVTGTAALPIHFKSKKYYFASGAFQDDWQKWHGYFDLKPKGKGEIGRCVLCHRVGVRFSSGKLTEYSTDRSATPSQTTNLDFTKAHWMPPHAVEDDYDADYAASIDKLVACFKNPTDTNCNREYLQKHPD